MAGPLAGFVVSLNTDGYIVSQGSVSEAMAKDSRLAEEMKHDEGNTELNEIEETAVPESTDAKKGKLVVAEEIAIGHVSWNACEYLYCIYVVHSPMPAACSCQSSYSSRALGASGPRCFGCSI